MSPPEATTYHQGHHPAVTANHVVRTAEVEGGFLLPHLSPDDHILDIGCGPGSITTGFAKYVPQGSVTGVDLTEEVIQQAYEHLSTQTPKPNNVTFEIENVLDGLSYEDGKFDVVYCHQTLIHIPDSVAAMKEMKRVCKPGGLVACRESDWPFRFVPYFPGLQLFNKYLYELVFGSTSIRHPDNAPHLPGYRGGSLIHVWAREAGFEPDRIVKKGTLQTWSTVEERKHWADIMVGRIEKAGHRAKFIERGATKEDVDLMVEDLRKWMDDVDGWMGIVQCEVISRA